MVPVWDRFLETAPVLKASQAFKIGFSGRLTIPRQVKFGLSLNPRLRRGRE